MIDIPVNKFWDYLLPRTTYNDKTTCLEWNLKLNSMQPVATIGRNREYVRRQLWAYYNGSIPKGYECTTVCNNPKCCAIYHIQCIKQGQKIDIRERLFSKTVKNNECILWIGYRNADGYGRMSYLGKIYGTHNLAWIIKNGPVPKGLYVLHVLVRIFGEPP